MKGFTNRSLRRAVTAIASGTLLGMYAPVAASADSSGGGANNVVMVVNTASSMLRGHSEVVFFGGDSLRSTNIASAASHDCSGCHSRAVAVQEVIVTGAPSTV